MREPHVSSGLPVTPVELRARWSCLRPAQRYLLPSEEDVEAALVLLRLHPTLSARRIGERLIEII